MTIRDRLGEWAEIRRVRRTEEAPDVAAGRDAERALRELIGTSQRHEGAVVLAGRRIPSRRQGRRREVDLIVCTPRMIHLIEAKNWSGRLEVAGGQWRQTRRNGEVVRHGDLLDGQRLRRDALVEYLEGRGLGLDDRFIREQIAPEIIFTNPKLEVDPDVEARADVITRRELDGYLGRPGRRQLAARMAASVVRSCLDREGRLAGPSTPTIPPGRLEAIVAALSELGTWDRLEFHGTRVVAGDLLELRIGARTYRRADLEEQAGGGPIRVRWLRDPGRGLFMALAGLGALGRIELGRARIAIATRDTVLFHAVGERDPLPRRLVELDRIVLG